MANKKRLDGLRVLAEKGEPMAEYIDRKALRDALYDADAITMTGVKILNQFPSADVAPVVHGRWILVDTGKGTGVCSNCNRQDRIDHLATHCRFCGARMNDA